MRFSSTQPLPIGLDVGHHSVRMLQLERRGAGLTVVAAARSSLPIGAHADGKSRGQLVSAVIRQMLSRGSFQGKSVVTALPRNDLVIRTFRVPNLPVKDLPAALEFEAAAVFPFKLSDAQTAYLPAGEVRGGTEGRQEIIAVGAGQTQIAGYLKWMDRAGVDVVSLDIQPCANYRSIDRFMRREDDQRDVHVLVDIGCAGSCVVIGHGRDIRLIKPIDLGGHHLHKAVGRKLGISIEESRALRLRLASGVGAYEPQMEKDPVRLAVSQAIRGSVETLANEISLCLRYYSVTFRGARPAMLKLTGGEVADPMLRGMLSALLPLPVEAARPLRNVDSSRMRLGDRRSPMSEWNVVLGLALRQTEETFGPREGKPRSAVYTNSRRCAKAQAEGAHA